MLRLDPAHKKQQLLRTPYGKCRDHDIPAADKRFFDYFCKRNRIIRRRSVRLIAICRFHNDIIRILNIFWIADQRAVSGTDIAGKYKLFRLFVFRHPQLYARRPKQVPGVYKTHLDIRTDINLHIIFTRHKMPQYPDRIVHIVKRCHFRVAGTPCLAVFPFRFKHLDMGTVL